jgi:hypothetical protein
MQFARASTFCNREYEESFASLVSLGDYSDRLDTCPGKRPVLPAPECFAMYRIDREERLGLARIGGR